jgi:hypothetical protein
MWLCGVREIIVMVPKSGLLAKVCQPPPAKMEHFAIGGKSAMASKMLPNPTPKDRKVVIESAKVGFRLGMGTFFTPGLAFGLVENQEIAPLDCYMRRF